MQEFINQHLGNILIFAIVIYCMRQAYLLEQHHKKETEASIAKFKSDLNETRLHHAKKTAENQVHMQRITETIKAQHYRYLKELAKYGKGRRA